LNLWEILVRPVCPSEEHRYRELMQAYHYPGSLPKIGETLWYVVTWRDEWIARASPSELFRRSLNVRCTGSLDPQCSGHCSRGNPLWDAWIPGYLGLGQKPRHQGTETFRLPLRRRPLRRSNSGDSPLESSNPKAYVARRTNLPCLKVLQACLKSYI
jgi:hypothetical protein